MGNQIHLSGWQTVVVLPFVAVFMVFLALSFSSLYETLAHRKPGVKFRFFQRENAWVHGFTPEGEKRRDECSKYMAGCILSGLVLWTIIFAFSWWNGGLR